MAIRESDPFRQDDRARRVFVPLSGSSGKWSDVGKPAKAANLYGGASLLISYANYANYAKFARIRAPEVLMHATTDRPGRPGGCPTGTNLPQKPGSTGRLPLRMRGPVGGRAPAHSW